MKPSLAALASLTTRLTAKQRKAIISISLFVILGLWVYSSYALKPMLRALGQVGQEVRTVKTQLRYVQQAIGQQARLEQESARLEADVGRLRTALPPADDVLRVIERFSQLAHESGVKIQTIAPQRSVEMMTPPSDSAAGGARSIYKEIGLQIEAVGGFHQLGAFLSRVEGQPQPVQVRQFRIATNTREARRHLIKLVVVGFFSTAPSKPMPARGSAAERGREPS